MAKSHHRNVHRVRSRDGRTHNYHRHTRVALPADEDSPEFALAWANEEVKARTARLASTPPPAQDTWAAAVAAFKASDAWAALKPRTKKDYERQLAWMAAEGAEKGVMRELTQARCEILLDKAIRERGRRQGIYVLQVNRRLHNWILGRAERRRLWGDANPWASIELEKAPPRPAGEARRNRPWKPWEVVEVILHAPLGLRRAYVLGITGFDGATIVTMRWREYVDGGFDVNRGKTDTESWAMVPNLFRLFLEEGERPSDFIATSIPGDAFTPAGLQKRSSEYLRGLAAPKDGSPPKVGPGLTLHGLRHTLGKAVAEIGGNLQAIQGALQHKSPQMAMYYSGQADRKRALAAAGGGLDAWFDVKRPDEGAVKH